jgi:hypothetical protein
MSVRTFVEMVTIGALVAVCIFLASSSQKIENVGAQGGSAMTYLVPQAGDATRNGGKEFIDLRNGNLWECEFSGCKKTGQYPISQIH